MMPPGCIRIWGTVAALGAALTACSFEPDYVRPNVAQPAAYRTAQDATRLPQPDSRWWRMFGSEQLDSLVEAALKDNSDLKMAVARIGQSEALAGVAAGPLLPTIQGVGQAETMAPAGGLGNLYPSPGGLDERLYSIGPRVSYELDLWGKNRAAMHAALAAAQASIFDRQVVAMTLVADVATSYFQYLAACQRTVVAERNVANMKTVLDKVEHRFAIGEGNRVEVMQQRTIMTQAEASLPPFRTVRDQALDKLAVLLGKAPSDLHLDCADINVVRVPQVAAGLPSELLLRRPDIRKAEANLQAATANIGVARANLLPSFSLTGERGWGSTYLSAMLSPASIYYTVGANIVGTIFDNGKTLSEIDYSKAKRVELIEAYRLAVLSALRDVDDALVAVRDSADQETADLKALDAASQAHSLGTQAYDIGVSDYLTVLETERSNLKAEDDAVVARLGRLLASVSLFKALGGGTDVPADAQGQGAQSKGAPQQDGGRKG